MQPYFEIVEGSDTTVDLEKENYKKYIHIRVNNIIKKFDQDGMMTVENNYSELRRCNLTDF